jgi:hypothetical protein
LKPTTQHLLNIFDINAPTEALDRIKNLVKFCQKTDRLSQILLIYLLPGAIIAHTTINIIIRSHSEIASFNRVIHRSIAAIVVSGFTYIIMWERLFPFILYLWDFFHLHNWETLATSLFQWRTAQAATLMVLHYYFSLLALKSFRITETFHHRYQALQKFSNSQYDGYIVTQQAENATIEQLPQIITNIINQTLTSHMVNGELTPETVNQTLAIVAAMMEQMLNRHPLDRVIDLPTLPPKDDSIEH